MEKACDSREYFNLQWIVEAAATENRRDTKPFVPPPKLTDVEQHAADLSAVKSLLWLHYAKGWTMDEIGKDTLGRLFARQRGLSADDVPALIEQAKESYPRETILRWMTDQPIT